MVTRHRRKCSDPPVIFRMVQWILVSLYSAVCPVAAGPSWHDACVVRSECANRRNINNNAKSDRGGPLGFRFFTRAPCGLCEGGAERIQRGSSSSALAAAAEGLELHKSGLLVKLQCRPRSGARGEGALGCKGGAERIWRGYEGGAERIQRGYEGGAGWIQRGY
eukprot:1182483-Prorocentrum_minimum.AAC.3